ncbi:MAG: metallophosphoesterase family protein [bacterium]|nr:metallophosphoesterase family protein [bacterium]
MRLALISDIHSNLEALEAVLADLDAQKADKIVCLGDVVGYGSDPIACLEIVERTCDIKLMGNHEFGVLGLLSMDTLNQYARHSMDWTKKQLTDREISIVSEYDLEARCEDACLVHASPYEPDKWHYILSEHEAQAGFEKAEQKLTFFGHTHLPMIFSQSTDGNIRCKAGHSFDPDEESRYLVNVGSVGQPRDNDPRACYVIYDSSEAAVTYHRVTYDLKAAQTKMTLAELPTMLIERLSVGR